MSNYTSGIIALGYGENLLLNSEKISEHKKTTYQEKNFNKRLS
jgi:hypothetical protein